MASRKLPNPMRDIEGAFTLAAHLLGVAEPIRKAFESASSSGLDSEEDADLDSGDSEDGEAGCGVCGDTLKVGRKGAEVPCPACVVEVKAKRACQTCGGTGKVGNPKYAVACPVCRGDDR